MFLSWPHIFEFVGSGILLINPLELFVELELIDFVSYSYVKSESFCSILFFLLFFWLIDIFNRAHFDTEGTSTCGKG